MADTYNAIALSSAIGPLNCTDNFSSLNQGGPKGFGNGHVRERPATGETEREDGLSLAFLLKGCSRVVDAEIDAGPLQAHDGGVAYRFGRNASQLRELEGSDLRDCQDLFVLVGNVEFVNIIEYLVPAVVRLEPVYLSDNIFSGKLGTSALDGVTKALLPPTEGELDAPENVRVVGLLTDHVEHCKVKRRSDVVNCVSNHEAENPWLGYLLFD